ncbi:MAG: hypothetical protein WCD80_14980 [Desulfobaccales bacterium]
MVADVGKPEILHNNRFSIKIFEAKGIIGSGKIDLPWLATKPGLGTEGLALRERSAK